MSNERRGGLWVGHYNYVARYCWILKILEIYRSKQKSILTVVTTDVLKYFENTYELPPLTQGLVFSDFQIRSVPCHTIFSFYYFRHSYCWDALYINATIENIF